MKKLYLAGGIGGVKDPYTWRKDVKAILPPGWQATDPLDLSGGVFKEGDDAEALIETDLTAVEQSEALVCRIDVPSWGSAMELFYAHECCIPTIGLRLNHQPTPVGPWLRVHCSIIVGNLEDLREYLATEGWLTNVEG